MDAIAIIGIVDGRVEIGRRKAHGARHKEYGSRRRAQGEDPFAARFVP